MLPKVANQLIHHTSRAVAAVQNQTGHTIRNVLHIQSSTPTTVGNRNGPGSSSSGRGSNGAGAGGARQSGSSRFHNTYSALSRSVTQADPSLLNSITVEVADEADEVVNATPRAVATRRLRQRAKSSSFSLGVHDRDVLQKSGLLHALQQHVRATHAFAPAPPASARAASREQVESVESAEEASVHIDEQEERLLASLRDAKSSNDPARVLKSVIEIRESGRPYTSSVYNAALDALHHTRRSGDSLKTILELYNDMVSRSVLPNGATYTILITALTDRDVEITAQISSVKKRAKRLVHLGKYVEDARKQDEARLRKLCREDNLPSALVLFQAGCLLRGHSFSRNIYSMLLRSCAAAGNVEAALRIFRHLETRLKPNTVAYRYLLQAHSRSGDLHGARGVFSAYSQATKAGRVQHEPDAVHPSGVPAWRVSHVEIWNEMIMSNFYHGEVSEALGVLHQMLAPDVSPEFQLDHTPPPSPSTYTGIIQAFIRSNDIDSALTWFHRLLQEPTLPGNPNISHPRPTKPTARAWKIVIEALAYDKKVEELNRIVEIAARDNLYELDSSDRFLLVHFNLKSLRDLPRDQLEVKRAALDQLVDTHVRLLNPYLVDSAGEMSELSFDVSGVHFALSKLYMTLGDYERVIGNLEWFVSSVLKDTLSAEQSGAIAPEMVILRKQSLRMLIVSTTSFFWFNDPAQTRPLHPSMRLAELSSQLDMLPRQPVAGHYIPSYLASSEQEKDLLSITHWELFVTAVCNTAYEVPEDRNYYAEHDPVGLQAKCLPATFDLYTVLVDMNKRGVDIRQFSREVKRRLGKALVRIYGRGEALKRIQGLDLASANELSDVIHAPDTRVRIASGQVGDLPVDLPDTAPSEVIRIDLQHSRFIDEFTGPDAGVTPVQAFARFQAGAQMGLYPRPEVIGRLISALGRAGEIEMLHELYKASQLVLAVLEYEKETQSLGWFQIEDQMIIGLAHAGQVDAAHVHRIRILEQGGCPSADAYGALIENVTDTTDDTTNALALFEEAGARGSHPNIYLYNTIISKLAKARKADHALELFQRMKLQHIRPTSVTYGALIAACCRVGDAISAETLFTEMTTQKNFKPRIPPYNTMMQLYTHTKPDRQRVLYYFKQMGKVGVNPTAHTYKLLMDAYGTIEPLDLPAMERTFDVLVKDDRVHVHGTHWAALINAWGCAKKDLDKAIQIFESIPSHPASQKSHGQPDAVVFEALTNVFVTLRRPDLIAQYRAKIPELGIRMTAYIANLLIKGYAAAGDIKEARNIFESLADPPEGIAAPYNHMPHNDQSSPSSHQHSLPDGTVYREPSTWEAMVRAELGHGNRDHAVALLERVHARRFPPAVYNRISGIMLDDSVSPWGRGSEASAPSTP